MDLNEEKFLKEQLDSIYKKSFPFQQMCDKQIINENNIILSMPTGSGKTDRFISWAINLLINNRSKKVIITSPIKALSNQRFQELYLEGYNVGIETGDVSYNIDDCTFLCCTQEIATNKYIYEDVITVIDEFHYIYNDPSRARTYIDYIKKSKSNYIFLCSATLGDINKIREYLNNISNRNFYSCECNNRLTNIIIKDYITLEDIKNAYVVSFSRDNCVKNTDKLRENRKKTYKIDEQKKEIILRTASKYNIKNNNLIINALYGVDYYYGSMLPKERLFVLELLQNHLIDTVFGTDAISLGVNFPIQNIVFTSLKKYGQLLNINLFKQIIGRAGRYGLYNIGYVYYSNDFQRDDELERDFNYLKSLKEDDVKIKIMPSIKNIISGRSTIEEEINYVIENSIETLNYDKLLDKINNSLEIIKNFNIEESLAQLYFNKKILPERYIKINWDELPVESTIEFKRHYSGLNVHTAEFYEAIINLYDDEFSAIQNCILIRDIICNFDLETILKDGICRVNSSFKDNFREVLQIRKFLNKLPNVYRNRIDLVRLDTIISNIDASVFDVELSFQKYTDFDIYSLPGYNNKKIVLQDKDKKENIQPIVLKKSNKKSTKNKKKPIKEEFIRLFEEGTLIKEAGASFASPKYLVLLYDNNRCILLNYNSYKSGFISLTMANNLKNYFQINSISKEEYKDILLKCKNNSSNFYSSSNSTKKELEQIYKILKRKKS